MPRALRPFATGQYRILAAALTLSLFGSGVWLVAFVWQVIDLGGTPIELSMVATGSAIGLLAAVLFGGVAADRIPQKYILLGVEFSKVVIIGVVAMLAFSGVLTVWHLTIAAFLIGLVEGFFFPAYTALLPSVLAPEELLAANGVEGVLRPATMQALGPLVASVAIAAWSPAAAFVIVVLAQALAAVALLFLRKTDVHDDPDRTPGIRSLIGDMAGGFRYMFRTPWLLGTLLFACVFVLFVVGPIEVLMPFAVKDQVPQEVQDIFGGGAGAFALVLAAFGLGGALGSLITASVRLPRRYLTVMNVSWGLACIPLIVIGFTDQLWVMAVAVFVTEFLFSVGTVIWGTLLQRRVPGPLLGRVSSLDFFVSLALMPVSMALAGPIGVAFGIPLTFVIVGTVPVFLAVAVILIARMPQDEIANPLDIVPVAEESTSQPSSTSP